MLITFCQIIFEDLRLITIDHNHDLRYNALRLPMTRKEYYVKCTKYQFLQLLRETTQFIEYFKYRIIDAYNPACNITICFVCAGS